MFPLSLMRQLQETPWAGTQREVVKRLLLDIALLSEKIYDLLDL